MITKDEILMDRHLEFPADYTQEISSNIDALLIPMNQIRTIYGKPMVVNSGWRPASVNEKIGGAPHSKHMLGLAVDISDTDGMLWDWALARLELMQDLGVYLEDKRWTPSWVHFQIGAPKSGKRIFVPNGDKPQDPKAWNGLYDSKWDRFPSAQV